MDPAPYQGVFKSGQRSVCVELGSTSPGLLSLLLPEEGKNVVPASLKGVTFLHSLGESTQLRPGGGGLDC